MHGPMGVSYGGLNAPGGVVPFGKQPLDVGLDWNVVPDEHAGMPGGDMHVGPAGPPIAKSGSNARSSAPPPSSFGLDVLSHAAAAKSAAPTSKSLITRVIRRS